jgi:hypothetical protein
MEQPNAICAIKNGSNSPTLVLCLLPHDSGREAVVDVMEKQRQTIRDGFVWPPIAVRTGTKLRSACLPAWSTMCGRPSPQLLLKPCWHEPHCWKNLH